MLGGKGSSLKTIQLAAYQLPLAINHNHHAMEAGVK